MLAFDTEWGKAVQPTWNTATAKGWAQLEELSISYVCVFLSVCLCACVCVWGGVPSGLLFQSVPEMSLMQINSSPLIHLLWVISDVDNWLCLESKSSWTSEAEQQHPHSKRQDAKDTFEQAVWKEAWGDWPCRGEIKV